MIDEEELLKILNKEKSYTEDDLLLFIYDLRKENKKLKERYGIRTKAYNNILLENADLKDNWNKLKEYAKENLYFYSGYQGEDLEEDLSIKYLLDKMQEIEGGMNE